MAESREELRTKLDKLSHDLDARWTDTLRWEPVTKKYAPMTLCGHFIYCYHIWTIHVMIMMMMMLMMMMLWTKLDKLSHDLDTRWTDTLRWEHVTKKYAPKTFYLLQSHLNNLCEDYDDDDDDDDDDDGDGDGDDDDEDDDDDDDDEDDDFNEDDNLYNDKLVFCLMRSYPQCMVY